MADFRTIQPVTGTHKANKKGGGIAPATRIRLCLSG